MHVAVHVPGRSPLDVVLVGPPWTIGRSADNDLVLLHGSVSRRHAILELRGDRIWIRDLASVNGVTLWGRAVTEVPLLEGDRLSLGDVCLIACTVPCAGSARPEEGASPHAPRGSHRTSPRRADSVAVHRRRADRSPFWLPRLIRLAAAVLGLVRRR